MLNGCTYSVPVVATRTLFAVKSGCTVSSVSVLVFNSVIAHGDASHNADNCDWFVVMYCDAPPTASSKRQKSSVCSVMSQPIPPVTAA